MGHGSGSHLSLLTIVQEAVVRSRDDHWLRTFESDPTADIEIAAGIKKLEIWGEDAILPPIKGLILFVAVLTLRAFFGMSRLTNGFDGHG